MLSQSNRWLHHGGRIKPSAVVVARPLDACRRPAAQDARHYSNALPFGTRGR